MESLAKEQIIKQALGDEAKAIKLSPSKPIEKKKVDEKDEIFKLPALDNCELKLNVKEEFEEPLCPKKNYNVNISKIDINSSHFKSLPADIRHDILLDIKETRKQNNWAKLRELPAHSQDFSNYQMSGLLRRRQVQVNLEDAEKEMGGKVWSISELESLLTEDGVIDVTEKRAQKIAADENTRFVLVRDIAKAINDAKNEPQPSTSKQTELKLNKDDEEYDLDLQRAIQMSLQDNNSDSDEEEIKTEPRKLNPQQRQKLGSTIQAHGLIRGFMKEYAEMNNEDIEDLIDATQIAENDELNDSFSQKFPNTDRYVLYGSQEKEKKIETTKDESIELKEDKNKEILITVDSSNYKKEEDIFADIFTSAESPDVEVASISSDDETVDYEIPEDLLDKSKENLVRELESGFVSEDGKMSENSHLQSDHEKFEENEEILEVSEEDIKEVVTEVAKEVEKVHETSSDENKDERRNSSDDKKEVTQTNEESEIDFLQQNSRDKEIIEIEEEQDETCEQKEPEIISQNEKFWKSFEEEKEIEEIRENLSENEKFWAEMLSDAEEEKLKNNQVEEEKVNVSDKGEIKVNLSPQKSLITKEEVTKAVNDLRKVKTDLELKHMKDELHQQQLTFEKEKNKLQRQGMSITHQMSNDCKQLLKLFGIPFIQSPMEAEAQCAFLNAINLTDGTITDDSDIWLFGAQTVYKNFFVQKKMVMEFRMENIDKMMHLDRNKLIQLAMLVGSDYTVGINGVGAVTALEILAAFPQTPETEGSTDQYQSMLSSLRKFREWFQNGKQAGPNGKTILKSKLKNVELFEGFPSPNVLRAYLEPTIDSSTEPFTWGQIDIESIMELTKTKLGWTRLKTEEIINPVLKRLNEKKQTTIRDYFKIQLEKKVFDTQKLSKRVQKAVGRMGGEEEKVEEKKVVKATRKRAATKNKKTEEIPTFTLSEDDEDEPPTKKSSPKVELEDENEKESIDIEDNQPSTSSAAKESKKPRSKKVNDSQSSAVEPKKKVGRKRKAKDEASTSSAIEDELSLFKKAPRIPETKQIILQRERDKEEMAANKQKAIEIFKNSKKPSKKK